MKPTDFLNHGTRWVPALAAVILAACASQPQSYVALLENADGTVGKVIVSGARGEQVIARAKHAAPLDGSTRAAPIADGQLQRDFGAAMTARPLAAERYLLYFETGGATLTAESAALLPQIIASAAKRPWVDVAIIGHTDTVGSAEANEKLGLQRAQAMADQFVQQGLKVNVLNAESHGERNLLVPTADEVSEPRNRRIEVSIR